MFRCQPHQGPVAARVRERGQKNGSKSPREGTLFSRLHRRAVDAGMKESECGLIRSAGESERRQDE